MKTISILVLCGFVAFCSYLVIDSGLFTSNELTHKPCILLQNKAGDEPKEINSIIPISESEQFKAANLVVFGAQNSPAKTAILGSLDPKSGFEFQLELSTKGAAIRKATFSGFDDRDYKNPQPLTILSPVGSEILPLANKSFVFVDQGQQLPLDKLHWKMLDVETKGEGLQGKGLQTVAFEAIIKDEISDKPVIRLIKTYTVMTGSYMLDINLAIENLSPSKQKVRFNLAGTVRMGREGARSDLRKVVAGFRKSTGKITTSRLDVKKLTKAVTTEDRRLIKGVDNFLWAAAVNKYFAAIVVPLPDEGKTFCDWIADKTGRFYNPDGLPDTGDETVGLDFRIATNTLKPGLKREYKFQTYLGPKNKVLFDKNENYKNLGFVQTIDFMACCCPASIISPMAFGILAIMEWMYGFIGNYGVVIIIFVFLIRLFIHPLTKKSQVSMSKFSKIAPKVDEIKKKYANNKTEMNKQIMALYKENGASPIIGMLPMLAQMPIWISLYSAIYASIALRGASFLPFWITDLSAPDALFRFATVTVPIFGWKVDSFNLLPLMMGVAFFLQQKLMPKQPSANPQAAQQQKMMMFMMPIMFPLMLYKAPSGVDLYIMASTFAGVIEQIVIRKHIQEKEEAESKGLVAVTKKTGGKVKKKKPKPFYKT